MSTLDDRHKHPSEDTIGRALAQVARLHRLYLNQKLADIGLFAGQEQVLQALDCYDAITMGELAALLRVRNPTVSKSVARLAALGLVERYPDPRDGRTVRVRLTRNGRTAVARIQTLWDEVESGLLAELGAPDQKRLRELLLRAAANLARAPEDAAQDFGVPHDVRNDHQAHRHRGPSKTGSLAAT